MLARPGRDGRQAARRVPRTRQGDFTLLAVFGPYSGDNRGMEHAAPPPAPDRGRRHEGWRALAAGLACGLVCLALASGDPVPPRPAPDSVATRIHGLAALPPPPDGPSWAPRPLATGGLRALATAGPSGFSLYTTSGVFGFLPGVNLGTTTPGHQPGELAVRGGDYRAWFAAMGWFGIRAVRVYTIHPPEFYTELAAYNRAHPTRPLYLVQGVYLPDESYVEKGNLYDPAVTAAFRAELRDASAAVSGDLTRPRVPGRAGGTWTADVSDWLAAWIIGVEWDPAATAASDARNAAAPRSPAAISAARSRPARPSGGWRPGWTSWRPPRSRAGGRCRSRS